MDTKMKGLFKGLRYISQIFDSKGEPEMQIGFPTDVKHVAHIGWDGPTPSPTGPTWMNEFQSGMEGSQQNTGSSNWASSGFSDSSRKATLEKPPSRPPRHKSSFTDPDSPQHDIMLTQSGGGSTRLSSSSSVGSPSRDIQAGSRHGRKSRSAGGGGSSGDSQPSDAPPTVPKQKNRRKVKGSGGGSSGGSVRSSRSRSTAAAGSPELGGATEEAGRGRPQRLTSAREGEEDSF
ncbi:hypothetical protein LUZ60_006854 [Juncus effusus]|nr:hypothetical protein LUZ60_006854 [Juncus effusus]